jgi:hypothetical protein
MNMTEILNAIAKQIIEQADAKSNTWPEVLNKPFFKANAHLINQFLNGEKSQKFLAIQAPSNPSQNVAALAALICSILKCQKRESDWVPEVGNKLIDTRENKTVYIALISEVEGGKQFHLKTAKGALHGIPNEPQLRKRYKPLDQDNNRVRVRTEPIDHFWNILYPSLKIEDGVESPPLVIGNLNRTLDDCNIRTMFPILYLGEGEKPMFPPVAIHAANASQAEKFLKSNKDRNRIVILIGKAATVSGVNTISEWIEDGKAKAGILISQKWLDRKELGNLNDEILRWVWGPAMAPIVAGRKAGSFHLEPINEDYSEGLISNFEKLRSDFFAEYQIKLNSQRFVFEKLGLIVPSQCSAELRDELIADLEKTWNEILSEARDEMFQAGYSMADLEKLAEVKEQMIKHFDFGKAKLDRLLFDDFQHKSIAIIPERLKDVLVNQERLTQWTMIHATTLNEFLANDESNRKPFLFSLYGHGKRRGPIRLLLALMQKNTSVRLMANNWEMGQYTKYIQSLFDWEMFALAQCKKSGLVDFEIPAVSLKVSNADNEVTETPDFTSESWENELLDRLTKGGWEVRSKAHSNPEDEEDPWLEYCTVEFEDNSVKIFPSLKVLPVKRFKIWYQMRCCDLSSGDRILEYEGLEGSSTRSLVEKYWPSDRLFQWFKKCRDSWKGGLSDYFERNFGGRDLRALKETLEKYGINRSLGTIRDWLTFESEIFFPQSMDDLIHLKEAGVNFRSKHLDEVLAASQGFDGFLIRFGKELAAELRQFRMEGKRGPKLLILDDTKVEWIERNMLTEKTVVRVQIQESDE